MKVLDSISESRADIPVIGNYDVVVVGGGIAGVAAALAAARVRGTRVCLMEKVCALGGLATVGNVIIYLPLCDGRGRQIIGGIGEELLRLSVDEVEVPNLRISKVPACWDGDGSVEERSKHRFRVGFNPITFEYKMERLLLKNHITLYYDMRFSTVVKENGSITAVIAESKAGRVAMRCKAVVDCSGEADVCREAGEKTVSIGENVRCGWYYYIDKDEKVQLRCLTDPLRIRKVDENGNRLKYYSFKGDTPEQVTAQVLESRKMMMEDLEKIREKDGGNPIPIMSPTIPTFRMSRRLAAKVTLKESDDHRWFDDTLGMTGDWRKAGPVFCLPLRCLAAVKTANLITAGRCLSSMGDTWDVTRVIPTCAVSGEAAGIAAAFLAANDECRSFYDLDIPTLQKYIKRHNGIIDKELVR